MIPIYDFIWKRLADYGAKYQSGADVVDKFNTKIAEVQLEVYNDLSPYYQTNEKVRAIMQPWVNKITGVAINGTYTIAVGNTIFDRVISSAVLDSGNNILFEINPITEGELVMASRLPQRRPDFSQKRVYYLIDNPNIIRLKPELPSLNYLTYYLVYPSVATIVFTFTSTQNEDIMAYDATNSVNLGWNGDAANIILYKMLEKYGIVNREQVLAQYAAVGVNMALGGKAA